MSAADVVVLALLGMAVVRGLGIGLVREVFSLAALGAAVVGVRLLAGPAGERLAQETGLDPLAARIAAGTAVAVACVAAVAIVGRIARSGVRAAGLGMADRLGGGVLGAAEGAVLAAVLLLGAIFLLGREDPRIEGSRSLAAFEQLEDWAQSRPGGLPEVAGPPPR